VTVGADDAGFVDLDWRGRPLRLECAWVGAPRAQARATIVFLHEGLGSVSMWRDFPRAFCDRHGFVGFVFSRFGYGRSTPRPHDEHWQPDFMARQADEVLPALFAATGIERPWLFGHSDGGTIALLHAARHAVAGVVAVETGDLRERLARHHADVDSAFYGWNDVWLMPAFRDWNIEREIATIACPVLAAQGEDDEYGTLEQVRAIARRLPKTRLLVIAKCGHSPHRDQPEILSREAGRFIVGAASTH